MASEKERQTLRDIAEALRAAVGRSGRRFTTAIIAAAGASSRMGGAVSKQHMPLAGMPVVVHALRAYDRASYIDAIVAVVREEDLALFQEYRECFEIGKLLSVIPGGATRQESVMCGLEAIAADKRLKDTSYVAVADGARPLTTPGMIDRVCLEAYRHRAATAVSLPCDTVKTLGDSPSDIQKELIASTVERSGVRLAATPQVFEIGLFRAAVYSAAEEGFETTDDNALVERIGVKIKAVDCGRTNIKITEPADLAIAEAILAFREKESAGTTS